MKLVFLRHGVTDHNRNHVIQGWSPTSLHEDGKAQAAAAGKELAATRFSAVLCSPLPRAVETAKIAMAEFADKVAKLVEFDALRERNFGEWENKPADGFEAWAKEKRCSPWELHPEQGESLEEFRARVVRFLDDDLPAFIEQNDLPDDACLLIVAHGGSLKVLLNELKHGEWGGDLVSALDVRLKNAQPVTVELKKEQLLERRKKEKRSSGVG